jgi:hypothetical protein
MLTDAPHRKTNRAQFLESDRIKTLNLPPKGDLQEIAQRLESAMKSDNIRDVRSTCTEFLASASNFYEVPKCGVRVLAARPLRTREHGTFELFGDYSPDSMLIPGLDADGGSQRGHIIRHFPEYPVPRVLSSSRFQEVWLCGLVAHSRVLRESGCPLPSCEGNAVKEAILGSCGGWALAN